MLARDLFVRCYSFEENQSEYLPSQGGNFDQMTQTHRRGAQEWQRQPPHPPGPYPSTAASRDLDPYPLQRAPAGRCGGGKTAGHSRFLGTVGAARDTERQRDRGRARKDHSPTYSCCFQMHFIARRHPFGSMLRQTCYPLWAPGSSETSTCGRDAASSLPPCRARATCFALT